MKSVGLGCKHYDFAVYIANQPNMSEYQCLEDVVALQKGEIDVINNACGNGWRKVFNVFAKLLYALNATEFDYSKKSPTWQAYRDTVLLQRNSATALLFSPPQLDIHSNVIHIICGRTYATELLTSGALTSDLLWLDSEFAIDTSNKLIVCPYFDYRQLSNIKITRLAGLIAQFSSQRTT